MGDYEIANNVETNDLFNNGRYEFKQQPIIITHREYIGDVITSGTAGAFKTNTYYINPGLNKTFPWLSQIAQNFESYRMLGCAFEFKSMSSDALNSTNTALG